MIHSKKCPTSWTDRVVCLLFAITMYVGRCFSCSYQSVFLFARSANVLVFTAVYLWGGYLAVWVFLQLLHRIRLPESAVRFLERAEAWKQRTWFFCSFIIILFCWLPYIILRYPAGIEYDAYYQIQQGMGLTPLNAHHPVFSSLIMGSFVRFGEWAFHSVNVGAFLFVLFQTIVSACVLSYTIIVMRKLKAPVWLPCVSLLVYGLVPFFPGYLASIVKDALYAVMLLLLTALFTEELLLRPNIKRECVLAVTAILVGLLRNNGIYVLLFCLAAALAGFIFSRRGVYGRLTIILLPACVFGILYSLYILPALGVIQNEGPREMLSIPFQQTARIARNFPEDVTEEEKELIDRVLVYDELSSKYDPLVSDPIKSLYHGDRSDLMNYFTGVWLPQLLRHPGTCINATVQNTYGFFFPDTAKAHQKVWSGLYLGTWNESVLQFDVPESLASAKWFLLVVVRFLEYNPVTMILCNLPIYLWFFIYLFGDAVFRRGKMPLFLVIPGAVSVLVCIASPTWWNNGFRYAIPVIYMCPLLAAVRLRLPQEIGISAIAGENSTLE